MKQPISRREFLRLMTAGAAFMSMPGFTFAKGNEGVEDKPNVLFIAVDDMNDWVGSLGEYPGVMTPNIDRLAKRGVFFTRAYCSAPVCNPSRVSVLTGIRPSTSGIYTNGNGQRLRQMMPNAVTLPQHFMAHGYQAVGLGKIEHGQEADQDPSSWNVRKFPFRRGGPLPSVRPYQGISKRFYDWGPLDIPDEEMLDTRTVLSAIDYLNQKHEKPFFLACGLWKPHLPWYLPRKYFDMYPPDKITLPEVKENDLDDIPLFAQRWAQYQDRGRYKKIIETSKWRQAVSAYLASTSFTDATIGRLIEGLEKSPYADNTIIVLWSDHGFHQGEKSYWGKNMLWEKSTRVPFIISAPGITKARKQCHRTVSLLDIYPTLVDLCGLSPRKELEGASLVPLLRNPGASWDRPALTTAQWGRDPNAISHSIRSEQWRYIRYADSSEELYDHGNDPNEWTNLADKPGYAEAKKELARWLPRKLTP